MSGFIELMMWLSALAVAGVSVAAVGEWKAAGRKGAGGVGKQQGASRVSGLPRAEGLRRQGSRAYSA